MDFRLYGQILWRHKLLVIGGLVLAIFLAELSIVRVSSSGTIRYRQSEVWSSTTRLGVKQAGRSLGDTGSQSVLPEQSAPDLNGIALLYAQLATSDDVRRLMLKDGPIRGTITADPVVVNITQYLPLIDLTAMSNSPKGAVTLAQRGATALETYGQAQQSTIPASKRFVIEPVQAPSDPTVVRGRSKTMPILIFLVVMFAFVGLAFLLENAKARKSDSDSGDEQVHRATGVEPQHQPSQRRSA